MTKQEIRQKVRELKHSHSPEQLSLLTSEALGHLRLLPAWRTASTLLLYSALPDEVPTATLLAEALACGREVLLPVVDGDDLLLKHYTGDDDMITGAFNIAEPQGKPFDELHRIDLAVVPGMAFTPEGVRLGRGRGYYDRLLPKLEGALKVGLCWRFQLLDSIPHEAHDICMDMVIC